MQMKKKKRQKDSDLELRFFFSNSAFCLCEQKRYKCRRACNTMYARTFAMRATLSAAPLHLVAASFNYQRGPMLFFFVCRLPPFGKTISVPRHQKQLQLLAFFFYSLAFLFFIFVTSAVLHRSRFFFFRARYSTQLSPLNIYIYFCKVLKAQKSCMNFFACPSIAVFF